MALGGFRWFYLLVLMLARDVSCLSALDCTLVVFFCCLFQAFTFQSLGLATFQKLTLPRLAWPKWVLFHAPQHSGLWFVVSPRLFPCGRHVYKKLKTVPLVREHGSTVMRRQVFLMCTVLPTGRPHGPLTFFSPDHQVIHLNWKIALRVFYTAWHLASLRLSVPLPCFCGALFFYCPLAQSVLSWWQSIS